MLGLFSNLIVSWLEQKDRNDEAVVNDRREKVESYKNEAGGLLRFLENQLHPIRETQNRTGPELEEKLIELSKRNSENASLMNAIIRLENKALSNEESINGNLAKLINRTLTEIEIEIRNIKYCNHGDNEIPSELIYNSNINTYKRVINKIQRSLANLEKIN